MATPATYFNNTIIDPSAGLELIDGKGEGIEATRYVFGALDVLDPDRRDQVERLRRGGEEVSSHCLRRSPNFVPRCTITPVEVWIEQMPLELVPDGVRSVEVKDASLEIVSSGNVIHNILRGKPLRSIRTYPGEELGGIVSPVGIMELTALLGVEWESGEAQRIQHEFFPADWPLPTPLRLIDERVAERFNAHPGVATDMRRSIAQSRRWAQARLQAEHVLLDTGTRHEHTYTYSPIARHLCEQLEVTPRDQGWETMMAQSNAKLTAAIAEGMAANGGNNANTSLDINALAAAIATATIQALNASKTVEQVKDEGVKMMNCEHCGEEIKVAGKSFHYGRWCPVLHPKDEVAE
jgi:hypothetical protein